MAELVAAAGVYQGSQPDILLRSDCQAGISTIHKAAGDKRPIGPQGLITTFLLKPHLPRSLTRIKSHSKLNKEKVDRLEDEDNVLFTDDTTCPLCGGADLQYHIIRDNTNQCVNATRNKFHS